VNVAVVEFHGGKFLFHADPDNYREQRRIFLIIKTNPFSNEPSDFFHLRSSLSSQNFCGFAPLRLCGFA
jgi:hypothetical protein